MIGVVGGGISGLFLLHFLEEQGLDAVLLEASGTPGGVMRSRTLDGPDGPVTVDLGPQRMRLTPPLAEVVGELGIADAILRGRSGVPFTMYRGGRLHTAPMSLREAVGSPLISWSGKVRAGLDLVTPGVRPHESVAHALSRKLGPEIYNTLAGPILGGLYASHPEAMDARHTLLPAIGRTGGGRSLLLALHRTSRASHPPVISFRGGMAVLAHALAERHHERIQLESPVVDIRAHGDGFALETESGTHTVGQVVLTLPAPEASDILGSLSPEGAAALGRLRYNPLAVVPLVVPAGNEVPDVGSGFKMTLDDVGFITRGVTAHEALFDRKGLFTAFLGGMGREAAVDRPDPEILETARREFVEVTGAGAVPLMVHRTRMPAWDRSWRGLDELELPSRIHLCAAYASRPGIVGRLEDARRLAERLAAGGPNRR